MQRVIGVSVKGFDVVVDEENFDTLGFQLSYVLQSVNSVSRKTGHLTSDSLVIRETTVLISLNCLPKDEYLSDLLMIFRSSSSTSSVGIPSERSILRNSFIPPHNRLHSKSVSFSLVFLLNIKMTSLYLVIPFYKEVCVLSNVRITKK